jgi:glycosyltransferase involved in cell wall biosynthesis
VDKATDKDLEISSFHRLAYFLRGKLCSAVLYRLVLPRANHIFVQSEQMKRDLAAIGIAEEKMTAVPMGIDLDGLEISENNRDEQYSLMQGKKILLYLGTMLRARRIEFLVDVLALVVGRFENVILVLVGDAPPADMVYLRRYVELSGMKDRVVFMGFIPRERVWGYIKNADVCLSPIRPIPMFNCSSPTKIVEYMALGRPVVANNTPDQDSLLRESGGGYSVPYTELAFADAVINLLKDPAGAEEMGKKGQAYVRNKRSYREIGDTVNEVYKLLIENIPSASE